MSECVNEKLTLEDLSDILNIKDLEKDKPRIVIIATRCDGCKKIHPFIFQGQDLFFMQTYSTWHLHGECDCGVEVSVYSGHGDIIFNPHNITPAT